MGKKINNDVYGISRLKTKDSRQAIIQTMAKNFNLAPKIAEAYYSEVRKYFEDHSTDRAKGGDILYEAVASEEGPGKPIRECSRRLIKLTFQTSEDFTVLKEDGLPAMRKAKIARFCSEAVDQGTVLTYEDLAHLLTTSVSTIKTDARELRDKKILLPTRGRQKDIGRSVSHKVEIINLWLRKYPFTDIEVRSGHSAEAIERYLEEFKRTVYLKEKGVDIPQIRVVTGRSEKLIFDYLDIYAKAKKDSKKYLNLKEFEKWLKKGAQNGPEKCGKGVRRQI